MAKLFASPTVLIWIVIQGAATAYRPSDAHGGDDATISPTMEAVEHPSLPEDGLRSLGVLNSGQLLQTSRRQRQWLYTEGSPPLSNAPSAPNKSDPPLEARFGWPLTRNSVSLLQISEPFPQDDGSNDTANNGVAVLDPPISSDPKKGAADDSDGTANKPAKGVAQDEQDPDMHQQSEHVDTENADTPRSDHEQNVTNGDSNQPVDDANQKGTANEDNAKHHMTKEELEKHERAEITFLLEKYMSTGIRKKEDSNAVEDFRKTLDRVEVLLRSDPGFFDINMPPGMASLVMKHLSQHDGGDGLTYLGRAAGSGWLEGVKALVEWDASRTDGGSRLNLNDGGKLRDSDGNDFDISPLTLAAEKSEASIVKFLLQRRASVMISNQDHLTPLEIAAASDGAGNVVEALLVQGSPLAYSLAPLRVALAKDAAALPKLLKRWPFGTEENDPMAGMKARVAAFPIHISAEEKSEIGDRPSDWVLTYKNRVMRAWAKNPSGGSDNAGRAESAEAARLLLAAHGYDSFAHEFSFAVVVLAGFFGIVGLFVYVIFRIKIYGGLDSPISLAHLVPGAFDPVRLADPDFDPSKQNAHLPYRASSLQLTEAPPSLKAASVAFVKSIFGVFSAWLFLSVRIPPVKDPFDEDFLSDDDEASRTKVCDRCADRARLAQKFEVLCRSVFFGLIIWWLTWKAQRWGEASIMFFMYLQFSLVAASAAAGTVPTNVPVKTNDFDPTLSSGSTDSARLTYAIFGAQHGPRWARAISTTRSTAAPSKTRLARRRNRKPPKSRDNDKGLSDTDKGFSEDNASSIDHADPLPGKRMSKEPEGQTSFSECWERSFLQAGLMHVRHDIFLELSVSCIVVVSLTVLWLTHLRTLALGSFRGFYSHQSASGLFAVYGAPGSGDRGVALLLELGLIFFTAERLVGIIDILVTASLSLQQRYKALLFASNHPPPPIPQKSGSEEATLVKEANRRIEECVHCTEFASELSALRWSVLRTPVLLIFTTDLMLLSLAMTTFVLTYVESTSSFMNDLLHGWNIDAMVPLGVALCLTWPLILVLVAASMSNAVVLEQRRKLREDIGVVLSAMPSGDQADDVPYVQLRLKVNEALQNNMICWPGGKELGVCEPCILLLLTTIACGFAVAAGATPGAFISSKQSFL